MMTVLSTSAVNRALLRQIRTVASCKTHRKHSASSSFSKTNDNVENVDIVISGGGMVGGAMACAMAQNKTLRNKKIVLLESGENTGGFKLTEKYSNRTCALSPATVKLLSSFGAWEEIEAMRCHPVLRMQVWESCSDSLITFNNPNMTEPLAHIVENDVILSGILRALEASRRDRVDVRYNSRAKFIKVPTSVDSGESHLPFVELELNDGSVLRTKLLIGADGMNSSVRKACGFHTMNRNYNQTALVATLVLGDTPFNNTAWQRFLPTGPVALLPLSDTLSSLVWTTTPDQAKQLLDVPSDSFVDALNDALWHEREKNSLAGQALDVFKTVLSNVFPRGESVRQLPPTVVDIVDGSRASFPLHLIHSTQYVQSRVALVGDAGHRLHPLAGQGVNLGFGDVECLSRILTQAAQNGSDLGSLNHLLLYETERQRHNVPVMFTVDGLQRLYSTSFTPLVILRTLGLHATHSVDFIKNKIVQEASI